MGKIKKKTYFLGITQKPSRALSEPIHVFIVNSIKMPTLRLGATQSEFRDTLFTQT